MKKRESGNIWLKGTYKNNEKDGKFTMYYQSGKIQNEEVFTNGIKNGTHVS
jgi:antitoxin component YwqK of YwqJK toxin-antitoxin module